VSFSLALLGESARAERALTVVTEGASRVGEQTPLMVAHMQNALAARAIMSRNRQAAAQHYEQAARAFESIGAMRLASGTLNNVGAMYIELGAYARATPVLRRALGLAEQAHSRYARAMAGLNLSVALARTGAWDEARQLQALAIAEFALQQDIRAQSSAHGAASEVLLELGQLQEAEREANSALAVAGQHKPARAAALAILADVLLSQHRDTDALHAATTGMEILAETALEERESLLRVCYAQALLRTGERDKALSALQTAVALLDAELQRIESAELRNAFRSAPEHARIFGLYAEHAEATA
jgi:tetratricopeptide (TPR) repeat protein